jgi:hypothetical protein
MKYRYLQLILLACTVAVVSAAEPVSRRDAARLQTKLDRINQHKSIHSGAAARTPITESEVNAYLQYELGDRIPAGVKDPWVSFLEGNKVAGRATVDLARVGQSRKSTGMLDPFAYLTGSLPVAVNGALQTKNGVGSFVLESAAISGVPVPVWMVQEIVTHYSKSPTMPAGVTIDKPFVLPSGIREIQLAKGQATIVQ